MRCHLYRGRPLGRPGLTMFSRRSSSSAWPASGSSPGSCSSPEEHSFPPGEHATILGLIERVGRCPYTREPMYRLSRPLNRAAATAATAGGGAIAATALLVPTPVNAVTRLTGPNSPAPDSATNRRNRSDRRADGYSPGPMQEWSPEDIARAAGARLISSPAPHQGPETVVIDSRAAGSRRAVRRPERGQRRRRTISPRRRSRAAPGASSRPRNTPRAPTPERRRSPCSRPPTR